MATTVCEKQGEGVSHEEKGKEGRQAQQKNEVRGWLNRFIGALLSRSALFFGDYRNPGSCAAKTKRSAKSN